MPTDEIETPSTTDDVATEPVADSANETEAVAEPKTYTSWQDALKDADPEELLRNDVIAGRVGQVADKLARKLETERKAADDHNRQLAADRTEELRLRELRSDNPIAYSAEMERRDATADAIRDETARQIRIQSDINGKLANYVTSTFPKEVVDSLAGKTYEGSHADGVVAYIAEITKASEAAQRARWEKDERPALRKQILTELNGGEPSIDSSSGGARAGKSKQYNSNLEASSALMSGDITIQEYTRQHRANGWR